MPQTKQYTPDYVCFKCFVTCEKTCEICGNAVCSKCGLKEMECKGFLCEECNVTPSQYIDCLICAVPHIHGYHHGDDQKLCTCPKCAIEHRWHVPDYVVFGSRSFKGKCPVEDIVKDMLKNRQNSQALQLFDGGCGCSPSCQPNVGSVEFTGPNKQKHEAIWEYGYGQAAKKWAKGK